MGAFAFEVGNESDAARILFARRMPKALRFGPAKWGFLRSGHGNQFLEDWSVLNDGALGEEGMGEDVENPRDPAAGRLAKVGKRGKPMTTGRGICFSALTLSRLGDPLRVNLPNSGQAGKSAMVSLKFGVAGRRIYAVKWYLLSNFRRFPEECLITVRTCRQPVSYEFL
jgi:hypothetical protein